VRLAWFAPAPNDVALELGGRHHVDLYDEGGAHDFVWRHFRSPYDLTIFELADSRAHAYIWSYLFHDPGIVILRAISLQQSRTDALMLQHRRHDLRAERAFAGPPLLRAPLTAARLVVVHDDAAAENVRSENPDIDVRVLPMGVAAPGLSTSDGGVRFRYATPDPAIVERAATRARHAGARLDVAPGVDDLQTRDVVIALEWPPTGAPPVDALRAMAAGLTAIVFETEAVAAWPTLDPQTWRPRSYVPAGQPIAISIDPRDEEHSLMLAMKRLASDAPLRTRLGAAAAHWTAQHANVTAAADAWEAVLEAAISREPSARAQGLPPHLTADGTDRTRALLDELGVRVDFLDP
jgi:hypothetical protein